MSDITISKVMYTLGQITSAVFPKADIPLGIQITLLSRPYEGLRMMREHAGYQRIPAAKLLALLDKVPVGFSLPEGQANEEHKLQFWAGFLGEFEHTNTGE